MPAIVTNKFRIYAAQKFIEGLGTVAPRSDNNVYLFIGKTLPWSDSDGLGATDNTPPYPVDTVSGEINVWKTLIHAKRIVASNTSLVIRRFDWQENIIYTQYDQDVELFDPLLGLQPFYVITDDLNVYKCLFNNNNSPSFVKPTGTSTNIIETGDKYLWKYMFTVSPGDAQKYLTNEWIPVKTLLTSDGSRQWDVQTNAVNGAIRVIQVVNQGFGFTAAPSVLITGDGSGAEATSEIKNGKVTGIKVNQKGSGYTFATATVDSGHVTAITITNPGTGYLSAPSVLITGDGSGATAHAVVSGGSLTSIVIDNQGSGYTSATVNIALGSGVQATALAVVSGGVELKVIIPPIGGHGKDPVTELGGFFAMLDCQLQFDENDNFTIDNDFRRLGLILNPKKWKTDTIGSASIYSQSTDLNFSSVTGTFATDVVVSGALSGATGVVLDFDAVNKKLRLVNVLSTFQPGENVATLDTLNSGLLEHSSGVAQGGGVLTLTIAAGDSEANHFYTNYTLRITSGLGAGQQKLVIDYNSTTKELVVDSNWTTQPDNTSHYSLALIKYPDLEPYSGQVLFVENRRPIMRSNAQLEDMKPVVEF